MPGLTALLLEEIRRPGQPPRRLRDLARALGLERGDGKALERAAFRLSASGEVRRRVDGTWAPLGCGTVEGRLDVTRQGYAFVATGQEGGLDVRVEGDDFGGACPGDRVLAEIHPAPPRPGGYPARWLRGRVLSVLERALDRFVAVVGPDGRLRPEDTRNPYWFRLDRGPAPAAPAAPAPASGAPASGGAAKKPSVRRRLSERRQAKAALAPDTKVLVQVTAWPGTPEAAEGGPAAAVLDILGPAGEPDTETAAILAKHQAPGPFPPEVKDEALASMRRLTPEERGCRLDLTREWSCTIDPDDAKDYDDALSIRPRADGGWTVGVHIADVARFVRPGGALDAEARDRATSIYLPGRVIPMLPEELSNDLCSLRPDEDRPAKTVLLHFAPDGERLGCRIHRSVIRSRQRLAYGQALAVIEAGEAPNPEKAEKADKAERAEAARSVLPELREAILQLHGLAQRLRARRREGGAIELANAEYHVLLDEGGRAEGIEERVGDVSHELVEEFMLAANAAVAEWAAENGLGALHRVHPPPSPAKQEELGQFLTEAGYPFKPPFQRRRLQDILDRSLGRPEQAVIHMAALRSFAPAYYAPDADTGHFALNFPKYLHFTSPIRRYPDLHLHQALDTAFVPGADNLPRRLRKAPDVDWAALAALGAHASARERRAMQIERETVHFRRLEFLLRSGRREWTATVTGVKRFGVFAQLDDCFVEGLLPRAGLERRGFEAREERPPRLAGKAASGPRGKPGPKGRPGGGQAAGFWLGQRVRVRVLSVDLAARECVMEFLGII